MNEDYEFEMLMLNSSLRLEQIDESDYHRLLAMLFDSDGKDYDRLEIINNELIQALMDHKKQKINDRLVIGAEMIEAEPDPGKKKKLMFHYNNLLKELTA